MLALALVGIIGSALFLNSHPPLAIRLNERPSQDDVQPLIYWQEPTKSGDGQLTTVRLDLESNLYQLNLLVNPPNNTAPEQANSRLELPTTMAMVGRFVVGINATSYTLPNKSPEATETWKTFIRGANVTLRGFALPRDAPAIGEGPAAPSYPILWQKPNGEIGLTAENYPDNAVWAFSAYHWLVKDGVPYKAITPYKERTFRSSAGISADGRWLFLCVCGPPPLAKSGKQGASLPEMANHFISLGVDRAINFDGGSSTSMVILTGENYLLIPRPKKVIPRPIPFMFGITINQDE
ncbi:phosphodiester glycosidase family protein [Cerasicoccus maritimus]|uniref:phosphodiester glycosidase family protein n=1 Tax=Cerasicoccus maritimus TaxID=490089 RepID=UPI0028524D92|nr:phosphodiester glycosidase family protein [Cerasicoccus maritimus]